MVDIKELRIGNWLLGCNLNYFQVDTDTFAALEHKQIEGYSDCPTAIPLTPEIFEKFGFYFRSEPKTQGRFVKQFEKSILEVFHIPHNFGSWHVIMNLSHVHSMGITVIQYVHELQNLIYSLYKTELNIKL